MTEYWITRGSPSTGFTTFGNIAAIAAAEREHVCMSQSVFVRKASHEMMPAPWVSLAGQASALVRVACGRTVLLGLVLHLEARVARLDAVLTLGEAPFPLEVGIGGDGPDLLERLLVVEVLEEQRGAIRLWHRKAQR